MLLIGVEITIPIPNPFLSRFFIVSSAFYGPEAELKDIMGGRLVRLLLFVEPVFELSIDILF
jgi:hypothetical protein